LADMYKMTMLGIVTIPALSIIPCLRCMIPPRPFSIRGEEHFKKLKERVKYEWEHFEE
jgi:hypothetical protein